MKGAKVGHIQWALFWLAVFTTIEGVWIVWFISLLFSDCE